MLGSTGVGPGTRSRPVGTICVLRRSLSLHVFDFNDLEQSRYCACLWRGKVMEAVGEQSWSPACLCRMVPGVYATPGGGVRQSRTMPLDPPRRGQVFPVLGDLSDTAASQLRNKSASSFISWYSV